MEKGKFIVLEGIDGSGTLAQVEERVWAAVSPYFQ